MVLSEKQNTSLMKYKLWILLLSILIVPLGVGQEVVPEDTISQEIVSEDVDSSSTQDVASEDAVTSFTLEESIAFARENSKSIKMAIENVELAKGKVDEAFSAMLPNLSASGSYSYFLYPPIVMDENTMADLQNAMQGVLEDMLPKGEENGEEPQAEDGTSSGGSSGSAKIEADKHNYRASLTLQQPLFTWGKLRNNYKQAQLSLQASEYGLEGAKQQLEFEVTNAFYGIVLTQKFIDVSKEAMAQVEKHHKTAEDLRDAGVATDYDVLRASVQLANMRSQLIKAKNALRLAKEGFKLILGLPSEAEVNVDGQLEYHQQEVDLEEVLESALENRPDLKQLELQEHAGEKIVEIAKAGNKPNLVFMSNVDANYSTNFEKNADRSWKGSWNVTFALDIPIFDGFATKAKVKQAKSGLNQIELGRSQLEDAIKLEVKSAYLAFLEAQELIKVQEETVEQAVEGLRIANLQHENGMITNVELTDAELAKTQTQVNRLQARYDYTIAIAKLEKATGKKF